ncbi:MAG: alanine racemase [Actinomycetota bacterium]|nr:alanine racemase [Actinomycetota bacterium]
MSFPCIKINLNKIADNAKLIIDRCDKSGIAVIGVTKSILADINIVKVLKKSGIKIFGDSRLLNLAKLRNYFGYGQQLVLLRTPMLTECEDLVKICDTSLQTELKTIRILSKICLKKKITHNIIIMVETDDRREGIYPRQVMAFFDEVYKNHKNIRIIGLGTNARCLSNKKPTLKSINCLIDLRNKIYSVYGFKIPVISGGNSSLWKYIETEELPKEVNQVRIGEAIFIGNETSDYTTIKGAHDDCFVLEAEIIEIKEKKAEPYKAIIALGVQDVSCKHLKIQNPYYEIIGQSSDHTVIGLKKQYRLANRKDSVVFSGEISKSKKEKDKNNFYPSKLRVGSIIKFGLNYFGLLSCMTSPFIVKKYI